MDSFDPNMPFPRWPRRRQSISPGDGIVIYVVIRVDRNYLVRSIVDNQPEVEVLAAFTSRNDAESFMIGRSAMGNSVMIHEIVLNPTQWTRHARRHSSDPSYIS